MFQKKIFAAVMLDSSAPAEFHIQMKRCWATPSADPEDAVSYAFLSDFCGESEEVHDFESLEVFSNGESQNGRFSLESFAFTNDLNASIYLHCDVRVCDSLNETCTKTCDERKRRSSTDDIVTLNSGEIKVRQFRRWRHNRQ